MRISDFITEAPIANFSHVGDWSKNSSYGEVDRKLLTNPKAVEKIKKKWSGVEQDFNMMFVNHAEGRKFTELGSVTVEWLQENMPRVYPDLDLRDDQINIIFTNNKGDERVPMTAWIIAHRFGHVLMRDDFPAFKRLARESAMYLNDAIQMYGYNMENSALINPLRRYEKVKDTEKFLTGFYEAIGTMKSAREGNLRNHVEFYHELLAQYIITGRITFAEMIPEKVKVGRRYAIFTGNEDDREYYSTGLEELASLFESTFSQMMDRSVGKIYVM